VPETRHAKEMNKSYDSIFWVKASMYFYSSLIFIFCKIVKFHHINQPSQRVVGFGFSYFLFKNNCVPWTSFDASLAISALVNFYKSFSMHHNDGFFWANINANAAPGAFLVINFWKQQLFTNLLSSWHLPADWR
jgi:hypothetical protein